MDNENSMFWSDGNKLYFVDTLEDVLPVSAAFHNLVHKSGHRELLLDFSGVRKFALRFILPLVTMARAYRGEKVYFDLVLPADEKLQKLFKNANWAHLISPEKFEARDTFNRNHLSAIQYLNADQHFEAVDRSLDVILKSSEGLDRNRLKALEWSLNEVTDNVLNHAESPVGGIIQVVSDKNRQQVEFCVCDAGVGIPRSLRQGRPQLADDVAALRAAIEEGVTRNQITNQGNGLFGTFKCCEVSGGTFEILSGNVSLMFKDGSLQVSKKAIPFNGTFVRAAINYGVEGLLERALVFKGKPHNPVYDYVERTYQIEGDDIDFKVAVELDAFGTRHAGQLARTKVENLMNNGGTSISFDFKDIHLISSSFADEVFGKLFASLGPIRFGQLCKFKNVDSTVQGLIDRAISQRMRLQ